MDEQTTPPQEQAAVTFSGRKLAVGMVLFIVVIGAGLAVLARSAVGESTSDRPAVYSMGHVLYCTGSPLFIPSLGFNQPIAFDTRVKFVRGIALRELDANRNILRSYQHPSWTSAGYLGSYVLDFAGNIYLVPIPFISIYENPPENANTIYRIDSGEGEMRPFIDLPPAAPVTSESTFGLMDIAYDCDTNMLYASSVLGSTYEQAAGRIFQIDVTSGAVVSILEGVDAFGLGVFNSANGKRLYFGSARTPDIFSIPLDGTGRFDGDIRAEISLKGLGYRRDERARTLTFQRAEGLLVKTLEFDFNLVAPTETRQTILEYRYDQIGDTWSLASSTVVNE